MSDIEIEDIEELDGNDEEDFDDDSGQGLAFDSDDDALGSRANEDDYGGISFGDSQKRKGSQSESEVDFTVLSSSDVAVMQTREITLVSEMTALSAEYAATLLRHFRWNRDKLIEKYLSDPDGIIRAAGIVNDKNYSPQWQIAPKFTCEICFDSGSELQTLALPCNHRFCRACYEEYVNRKIMQESESRRVLCPARNCKLALDDRSVKFIVPEEVFQRYRKLSDRTFVDDRDNLRYCPAPNCENAIQCNAPQASFNRIIPTVICACGNKFCFNCGLQDHRPSLCMLLKRWMKKCADDSETAHWINANTKECLKCKATIEKNGGCNHMTCRKCKYEFCWVCSGPWSEHGSTWYNCNRFDEKSSEDARSQQTKSRESLQRYLHYYNRYANHERSSQFEKQLFLKVEQKMESIQHKSDLTWIEVQFLKKAAEALADSRATLKYTYVLAFYLKRNNLTQIFEDNQRDLELATEHLSEMVERDLEIDKDKIRSLKQGIIDKTVYVNQRREILLSDTLQGFQEDRWEYTVDVGDIFLIK